jgi:hypothetical protein
MLRLNADVFAWKHSDMTGIPRTEAEHRLDTFWKTRTVVQKKRNMCPERSRAMIKQVKEMVKEGILWEVKYHSWIANPVMVRKKNES